jgi:predicted AAA+ superfamily ATPase/ABC-type multidrug transport system ATPase subunit
VTKLSGGERRRVALCRLLLSKPDMILLDEPTNHLDAESVAWLERFLAEYSGTVIAVTHDRYFLDNVAGWILELDRGRGIPWEGNYSSWLEQKEQRLAQEAREEAAHQRTIKHELEWVRSNPKGRHAKSKARVARFEELNSREFQERNETNEIYIPVIGPNGAGKTTLFRLLTGQEQADAGTLRVGETVELGYVDQSRDHLDDKKTVWEEISGGHDIITVDRYEIPSRAYVGRFNFKGSEQQKRVGDLSGGERNRVHLAKLLKSGGNVLLLDEPTNDLDVETLRALEEARLRGRQPGDLVRGQLRRLRGRPPPAPRHRRRPAAPHQVQAAGRLTMADTDRLLARAETLLARFEELLPGAGEPADWSAIAYRWRRRYGRGRLEPVPHPHRMLASDLLGIDRQLALLDANTRQFVAGAPANNALLWGSRGTGKSSLIKALLTAHADAGLRLVEVDKHDLLDLPDILALLDGRPERFLLFCDDLSFEAEDPSYKALKALLDGSISVPPDNVLIYATSKIEEKVSLSDRFGLWISFHPFGQAQYLEIVRHWLEQLGARPEPWEVIEAEALRWALARGSRSGRTAHQYARDFAGRQALAGG